VRSFNDLKIRELLDEKEELLRRLASFSDLIHGSFLERYSTCSRPICKCHRGEKHGPRAYVVITQDKKQKQLYILKRLTPLIRRGIKQYHEILRILDRITVINLILMKGEEHERTD
jgi:hypothetical protein